MCCKSRFSGADFSDLREGAAHSASVGVANHHKLLDTRGRGADAGDKGISAAAIKSIKQRILGDR